MSLTALYDADRGSNIDDRKLITAYYVFAGNNLVSWSSKKQSTVARSSIKFEYHALAHAALKIIWLKQLLYELAISTYTKPVLWCDNLSAGALVTNPVFHAKTKEIKIDVHFIHDQVLCGALKVQYIPSLDQLANCLNYEAPHSLSFLVFKVGTRCN